jgi:hypothetical protein
VRVHFGLETRARVDAVIVEWPDGHRERWREVATNQVVTLRRGTGYPSKAVR